MNIKIIAFGQIAEITGKQLAAEATDTAILRTWLLEKFPALGQKKYAIAVNKKVVTDTVQLNENDEVALMPPYSGG